MKKVFAFILAVCAVFSFSGCKTTDITNEQESSNIVTSKNNTEISEDAKKSATLQEAQNAYAEVYADDITDGVIDGRPAYTENYAAIGGNPTFEYEANGYTALFDGTEWTVLKGSFFTLVKNDDFTYSYRIVDVNGNMLFENEDYPRRPKVTVVAPTVYGLVTQTGTGLSTNWAVFCDVAESKTSEYFQYVLAAKGEYVVYVDRIDSESVIIVQNIFNKDRYYKEYKLTDPSPVAADIVIGCRLDSEGNAIAIYYAGEDYAQTELTMAIPFNDTP